MKIKEFITEDFDRWEIWVYAVVLPLGFIASAFVGYLFGKF